MPDVLFYHLERAGLEDVLPGLLERSLARGWRCLVRCGDLDSVERLDRHLWTYTDESFLPHGAEGGAGGDGVPHPVWLTDQLAVPEGREAVFVTDARPLDLEAAARIQRTVLLFGAEGRDAARSQWSAVKASGIEATYWRQGANGRWEKAG